MRENQARSNFNGGLLPLTAQRKRTFSSDNPVSTDAAALPACAWRCKANILSFGYFRDTEAIHALAVAVSSSKQVLRRVVMTSFVLRVERIDRLDQDIHPHIPTPTVGPSETRTYSAAKKPPWTVTFGSEKTLPKWYTGSIMDDHGYFHTFPAARGTQAGRPFFIAMCPLRVIPKLFVFDEEEVPAELRAQRTLNWTRIPEIAHYLVSRRDAYVMSALTASVDAAVKFQPFDEEKQTSLGHLHIPMGARILINDGQHRRAAIEEAIKENPGLGSDNVPVLFFVDEGLARSQQMFADLNRYAVRPSDSLTTLYDHRDESSDLARYLAAECTTFKTLTEFEKSTISNRSTKLFTLSSIKRASRALLRKGPKEIVVPQEKLIAKEFWEAVAEQIPDWINARQRNVSTAELRQEFVHAHGVTLQALGMAGAELLAAYPKNWRTRIKALKKIDWSRTNTHAWEGRAIVNGRISKANSSVQLASNYIKQAMGLTLSPSDRAAEAIRTNGRSSK